MTGKNYGVIDTVSELEEYFQKIIDSGNVFGFDIETGYDGPDMTVGPKDAPSVVPFHPSFKVVGFSFTDSLDWARYVPLAHDTGQNIDDHTQAVYLLWKFLQTGKGVAHNASFELQGLSQLFLAVLSDHPEVGAEVVEAMGYYPVFSDSMHEASMTQLYPPIQSAVLKGVGVGLKGLTLHVFGHKMTEFMDLFPEQDSELGPGTPKSKRKYVRFNTRTLCPQVIEYACEDSVWCLALHKKHYPMLADQMIFKVEILLLPVLARMERVGLHLDWDEFNRRAQEILDFKNRMNELIQQDLSERLGEVISINLGSSQQVAHILFERLGLTAKIKTDKGAPSTGEPALRAIAKQDRAVRGILELREIGKLLSSYIDKYRKELSYAKDGRAHPNHKQLGAATGRFSVDHVSYQQWPKPYTYELTDGTKLHLNYRNFLTSPEGFRQVGFDYSQVELRILAGMANETALLKAFADGVDIHRATASTMKGIPLEEVDDKARSEGKTINFAVVYGSGAKNIGDLLGIDESEAQQLLDDYFLAFPGLQKWMEERVAQGQNEGFVTTRFGRVYKLWEYVEARELAQQATRAEGEEKKRLSRWSRNQESKGNRMCVNAPVQGGAADYIKIAMIRADKAIREAGLQDKVMMFMTVHDHLAFYVHESIPTQQVIDLIGPCVSFPVPGLPEIRADWYEADRWGDTFELDIEDSKVVGWSKSGQTFPSFEVARKWLKGEYEAEEKAPVETSTEAELIASISMPDMPIAHEWENFKKFLQANPGPVKVTVEFPVGKKELTGLYSILPHQIKEIESMLTDSTVKIEKVGA